MAEDNEGSAGLGDVLRVPVDLVASRVRNGREAELIMEVAAAAAAFDYLLNTYETLAAASHALQQAWDALWMAQDPRVVAAVPVIGSEMSRMNWARARVAKKMEVELQRMQTGGKALRHFVDVNSTIAEELKMEGVERLAAEKLALVEMERGLQERISKVFEGVGG